MVIVKKDNHGLNICFLMFSIAKISDLEGGSSFAAHVFCPVFSKKYRSICGNRTPAFYLFLRPLGWRTI